MLLFFSDLDNTLIYSHRTPPPGEIVAVEFLNGHVQSYMTQKTYEFLAKSNEVLLVPTTTRTTTQYARLADTFNKFGCRYALVCNGGVLLINNMVDPEWITETKRIAGAELAFLNEAEKKLLTYFPEHYVHSVDGIMLYAKTDSPATDADRLSSTVDTRKISIYYDSRKVYFIPSSINKGNAIRRFLSRISSSWTIAAGDSEMDVPMLNAVDTAILPHSLSEAIESNSKYVAGPSACLSDYICDVIKDFVVVSTNEKIRGTGD